MNSIFVIHPYRHGGTWVFDDPAVGLRQEPFVAGADIIIDKMVEHLSDAERGFTLLFSPLPFPGYQVEFEWRRKEFGGDWYYSRSLKLEGWLCPALLKYFDAAPERLYVLSKEKKG